MSAACTENCACCRKRAASASVAALATGGEGGGLMTGGGVGGEGAGLPPPPPQAANARAESATPISAPRSSVVPSSADAGQSERSVSSARMETPLTPATVADVPGAGKLPARGDKWGHSPISSKRGQTSLRFP